jgi:hypothetical protein
MEDNAVRTRREWKVRELRKKEHMREMREMREMRDMRDLRDLRDLKKMREGGPLPSPLAGEGGAYSRRVRGV